MHIRSKNPGSSSALLWGAAAVAVVGGFVLLNRSKSSSGGGGDEDPGDDGDDGRGGQRPPQTGGEQVGELPPLEISGGDDSTSDAILLGDPQANVGHYSAHPPSGFTTQQWLISLQDNLRLSEPPTISWTANTETGALVSSSTGESFSFAPTSPGIYTVAMEVKAGQWVISRQELFVVAADSGFGPGGNPPGGGTSPGGSINQSTDRDYQLQVKVSFGLKSGTSDLGQLFAHTFKISTGSSYDPSQQWNTPASLNKTITTSQGFGAYVSGLLNVQNPLWQISHQEKNVAVVFGAKAGLTIPPAMQIPATLALNEMGIKATDVASIPLAKHLQPLIPGAKMYGEEYMTFFIPIDQLSKVGGYVGPMKSFEVPLTGTTKLTGSIQFLMA